MKLNLKTRILAAFALLGLVAFGSAAYALTSPPSFPARVLPLQTTVHFRKVVNFNDGNISTGVKFGALPQGAYILGVRCYVSTAFNAGTTNSLAIGTTAAGSDILAAGTTAGTNCVAGTAGNQSMTSAAGLGLAVAAGTPTGSNGGFDLFVRYTQTGTAATAGAVTFVIDYIANDDN
jgi:hypothetical protein